MSALKLSGLSPEIALVVGAVVILLLDSVRPNGKGKHFAILTSVTLIAAGYFSFRQLDSVGALALSDLIAVDTFGAVVRLMILGSALLATLVSQNYLSERNLDTAEFFALLLLSTTGMTLLAVSVDLLMVFLSIELLSLALYVLVGYDRERINSGEGAMKYFLLGAFASAFLLYGIAWIYGATGSTNLLTFRDLAAVSAVPSYSMSALALGFLTVGLAFKVSIVPFHMWTPDAYEAAPTPVTAFMSAATKIAAFAAIARIFVVGFQGLAVDWRPIFAVLALLSIVVGSILAITQSDLKRMLAYSSIAHAGFAMLGIVAASQTGLAAMLVYLAVYAAMTIGAFSCLMALRSDDDTALASFSGIGRSQPGVAAAFAFLLLGMAGIPPTGGFFAKFYLFFAVAREGFAWVAVIAVVASAVAAFFYIRVIVVMFMQDKTEQDEQTSRAPRSVRLAIAICTIVVVGTGVAPGALLDQTSKAARTISTGALR